ANAHRLSPMTSTTPPMSAAAEQNHHQNDNQDQVHGISPLMVAALFFRHLSDQRRLSRPGWQRCRPGGRSPDLPEVLEDCLRTLGVVQRNLIQPAAFITNDHPQNVANCHPVIVSDLS